MVKARMMVERPDEIEMTLKLTMSMKEWDELREQLKLSHPSSELVRAINVMLSNARKVYFAPEWSECFSDAAE